MHTVFRIVGAAVGIFVGGEVGNGVGLAIGVECINTARSFKWISIFMISIF